MIEYLAGTNCGRYYLGEGHGTGGVPATPQTSAPLNANRHNTPVTKEPQ